MRGKTCNKLDRDQSANRINEVEPINNRLKLISKATKRSKKKEKGELTKDGREQSEEIEGR